MLHVEIRHDGPCRGADQGSHPPHQQIHLVVAVSVGREHVHHQDVVQVETLEHLLKINPY